MAKKQIRITKKHYVTFDSVTNIQSTLTAYGKLVEGGESLPSTLGISHPHGVAAPLNKSLVYGVQIAGQCIRLPQPQEVALPVPDGRADGCGWDASEFVVWKNLPRDWITLHFQSRPRSLVSALSVGRAKVGGRLLEALTPKTEGVGDQVIAIVKEWSGKDPGIMDTLGQLWQGKSVPFPVAASNLAGLLHDRLGTQLQGTDFAPSTTVDDVIHDVVS
jgi:hypothetical protein